MSNTSLSESLSNHIKPIGDSQLDESVDAMQNYLTLLKKHAESNAELAEEKLAEHEEDLDALKKKRRKRRNYGTRTGIVLEDGTDTHFEV
ncbi:MAG: hypothetical protein AAFV93_03290 [Chloroflexota bacterium]